MLRSLCGQLVCVLASCAILGISVSAERHAGPRSRIQNRQPSDIDPLYAAVAGLVSDFGYPFEQHFVQTSDGYNLRIHRVPAGRNASIPQGMNRPVVLLQHGLLDCSVSWLVNGPQSLAFMLADAGFDVWLSNSRGNTFARNHTIFPPDSDQFWAFSWDDMAALDLPATIDYVLSQTGSSRVKYVGFSQGTTIMLAALASQPELAAKVEVAALLGVVAFVGDMTSVLLRAMCDMQADMFVRELGMREFLPSQPLLAMLEGVMCKNEPLLCLNVLTAMCGYNPDNLDTDRLPSYLKFTPSGTSVQNMRHWLQAIRDREGRLLKRFDFGTRCLTITGFPQPCNQQVYGSDQPPTYNMSAIVTPLAIYTGGQDRLADPLDVEYLLEALPAQVLVEVRSEPSYEHLDFTWGINAHQLVYPYVIAVLQRSFPLQDEVQQA